MLTLRVGSGPAAAATAVAGAAPLPCRPCCRLVTVPQLQAWPPNAVKWKPQPRGARTAPLTRGTSPAPGSCTHFMIDAPIRVNPQLFSAPMATPGLATPPMRNAVGAKLPACMQYTFAHKQHIGEQPGV